MSTRERPTYEVAVVGGGPAGMTTAIYATRLGHRTAVFEREGGRHARASHVHNLYGVSEDVSGEELSKHAVDQFLEYGGDFFLDVVTDVHRMGAESAAAGGAGDGAEHGAEDGGVSGGDTPAEADADRFVVDAANATVEADRVVFATGFSDVDPPVAELQQFTGRGLFYCLHCDAYELGDAPAFVLGNDDHAAEVAMLLLNFTPDVDLLLDGQEPACSDETSRLLEAHPVDVIEQGVVGAFPEDGREDERWLGGIRFADGTDREYHGGFAMYGREYNADLASSLGCEVTDEGAVDVDDRGKTSVEGAYAVGDVTHGQNQTAVAIGDGATAGVALHKDLRRYPLSAAELDDLDASTVPTAESGADPDAGPAAESDAGSGAEAMPVPAVADDIRARMRLMRHRESHAGLREPSPDR